MKKRQKKKKGNDRQMDRKMYRWKDRQKDKWKDRQAESPKYGQNDRMRDRQKRKERPQNGWNGRLEDKWKDTQKEKRKNIAYMLVHIYVSMSLIVYNLCCTVSRLCDQNQVIFHTLNLIYF